MQERQFTSQYNDAIIRLIRYKFQPLQHSKLNKHHKYQQSRHIIQTQSCHITHQISLPSLPSSIKQPLQRKSQNQYLLQRVKEFIKDKRKYRPNNEENRQLKEYIQLFQKPIGVKQRGKRQSIELSLMQLDTRQRLQPLAAINTAYQQPRLNEEEISIMNAKIRRKLNHKKMIDLAKRA